MPQVIAVINAGSSSLKFSLLADDKVLCRGLVDRVGLDAQRARVSDGDAKVLFEGLAAARDRDQALEWVLAWTACNLPGTRPAAVGHRVVHGGDRFRAPVRVTAEVIAELEQLVPLAPLHQPHNLAPIKYLARRSPQLPQVACFDTAFHATQGRLERMFALPRAYFDRGIQRYGFHGLSYESIAAQLPELSPRAAAGKTIVCHLGNGASLCAMAACRSVATTMSFSTLDGIPMGTRPGAVDPGVLLHLLERERMSVAELHDLLYKRSGLLGLSGVSSDMRDLLASPKPEAAEVVEYFCHRIAREIGSLAAALGGLDAMVFTGGIGEHAAPVRAKVCERATWLGVRLQPQANEEHCTAIHASESAVEVLVVPTDEERVIARHVRHLLKASVEA